MLFGLAMQTTYQHWQGQSCDAVTTHSVSYAAQRAIVFVAFFSDYVVSLVINKMGNAWKEIIVTKLEMVHGGTEEDSL